MNCSLIISVYNDIRYLTFIYEALKLQTRKDFEVVIADDGSNTQSVAKIKELIAGAPFPTTHVWHEDNGWQKNIILNKAVVAAKSDYLIFIDGDCIPHRKFIEEHLHLALEGRVVAGRRVQLTPKVDKELTVEDIKKGRLHRKALFNGLISGLKRETRHTEEVIRITNGFIRHLILNERYGGVLGCNFSLYKDDLLSVNGFDERYKLPAIGEDTDVEARLNRIDIYAKVERHILTVYHKSHIRKVIDESANEAILSENNNNLISWTPYGIKKGEEK